MSVFRRPFKKALALPLLVMPMLLGTPAAHADGMSLADAYKVISTRKLVDLTHGFSPTTPVWQGFGQASFTTASDPKTYRPYTLEQDGFRTTFYSMVGQYGTHVDPPAHFHANGLTMDRIPLQEMILPLVVFDITPLLGKDPHHALTVQDILEWEKKHGRVPKGAFAALRTDMSKDWGNPERFKRHPFPAWSLAAVQFLVEKRHVTAIGHESLDTDSTPTLDAEKWLLGQGRYQLEVMAHLDEVPPTGALIVATWPKVENGLGFPARAFAILP
ncbi:cyclase family protein [Melittangium boletus]|uniref:Cyclase n=1 Tax=Melittangium boletus DSM 14713 TaxID=1294270 RepID=A0A250IJ89_9BACT|nr:cyclase family protein [Melittangium boletus]ATB31016.1 cyclase [Melittangium boletus DSM 14713]